MSPASEVKRVAEVLLDDALHKPLDYRIPEGWNLCVGSRVRIPVRTTQRQGTVVALKENSLYPKLSEILEVLLENTQIPSPLFKLAQWVSMYYCAPLQKVLTTLLPASVRGRVHTKKQLLIKSALSRNALASECEALRKKSPAQALILDALLQAPKGILLSKLLEQTQASRSTLEALVKRGVLLSQTTEIDRTLLSDAEYLPTRAKKLNDEQQETLGAITSSLDKGGFEVRLIHGVTGSGKTEVYLQAIEHALTLKKGVIFLVPEVALTSQMIEKLKGRFRDKIALLHYRLSAGERFDAWHQMRRGEISIVIGARSAIFSPIQHLGLIIVDEEHEASYKQSEEAPCYHARDVAVMRGKLEGATVLLGSATPSVESYANALKGKYQLSVLNARADSASLPTITLVDMKRDKEKSLFSSILIDAIKKRLELGEQTLLFLNRRGYHTSLVCSACNEALKCPHCDMRLTLHLKEGQKEKTEGTLSCHLCDFTLFPLPRSCPQCKSETLQFKGAGTELVERALHALLPEVRTLRLDADTTRHKGSHETLFKQFRSGKADVLIGTQMIAKGLHFPQVTLVAVLNADGALHIPDFRAGETTFQLLTQVAGRSGRGALKGEVLLQTHLVDHPLIALAQTQDYQSFFNQEIHSRELFGYPPYAHFVKLVFKGKDSKATYKAAARARDTLLAELPRTVELLPVVPSGHAKVKELHSFQFLIKTKEMGLLLPVLKRMSEEKRGSMRLLIDVDPLSTFF